MEVYKVTSLEDHANVKAMVYAMDEEVISQALCMLNDIDEVEIVDKNDKSCSFFIVKDSMDLNKIKESLNLLNIDCTVENITPQIQDWELKELMKEYPDVGGLFNRFIYQTSDLDDALDRVTKVGQDNLEPVYKRIIRELAEPFTDLMK